MIRRFSQAEGQSLLGGESEVVDIRYEQNYNIAIQTLRGASVNAGRMGVYRLSRMFQPARGRRGRLSGAAVCAFSALFTAMLSFLPFLIRDRGFLTLAYDYNLQQIPFAAAVYEGIKQLPAGQWVWNLDLGSSLISGFGFYNLGSPFFWVTLFFPKDFFPFLSGGLYILKYMTAALLAYGWLKQFAKNDRIAAMGGLLYAFSGFQSTNLLFYHFHEIVAFFPLLLLGLDLLMKERKCLPFSFAVFLNALVNYAFFIQEALFLAVYFLFRYFRKDQIKTSLKDTLRILCWALLGLAMSAFLFVPNAMYVLHSARGKSRISLDQLLYDVRGTLFILKGFLMPGEAMSEQSTIYPYQYGSTSLYLPFFGMSFVLIYLYRSRGWLRNLLIVLILISFSPLIQSGFMLFTEPNQRWWYMLNLLCVLATILALEKEQHLSRGAEKLMMGYAGGVVAYCLFLWAARGPGGGQLVQNRELFFCFGGLSVFFAACCVGLIRWKRLNPNTALTCVLIASFITTGAAITAYKRGDEHETVQREYQVGLKLKPIRDQYRYDSSHNLYLLPGHGAGVGAFSSTAENSSYAFRSKVYDFNANFTYESIELPGLSELLGGKYEIITEPTDQILIEAFEANGVRYGIAEKEACPIGFATENYILLEELKKYEKGERSYVLMDAVVVEDPDQVFGYHERRHQEYRLPENILALIQRTEGNCVQQFSRDAMGFQCNADFQRDQLVFFSVPNDAGWTARLDGERAEIIDSCGMMALSVPAGPHHIEFIYETPGARAGFAISVAGLTAFCGIALLQRKRRKF